MEFTKAYTANHKWSDFHNKWLVLFYGTLSYVLDFKTFMGFMRKNIVHSYIFKMIQDYSVNGIFKEHANQEKKRRSYKKVLFLSVYGSCWYLSLEIKKYIKRHIFWQVLYWPVFYDFRNLQKHDISIFIKSRKLQWFCFLLVKWCCYTFYNYQ